MDDHNVLDEVLEQDYYSEDLFNITSWGADISFRELIMMYDENELLKPEFQRNYVWDKTEASRFVESLLMGLPVPSIFLANMENEKRLIIDGYQRIMTIYDYVQRGIFSKDNKAFKLSNSKVINSKWRGKSFNELNEIDKRRIRNTTIHAIIFEQKSPSEDDTSLYQVFERINTSGRALTPQEIRNCVYQGSFNTLLLKLNNSPEWRILLGQENLDSRMRDVEQILRFFTIGSNEVRSSEATQISLKKQLNLYMGSDSSKKSGVLIEREKEFINTMKFILEHIGEDAFHNINKSGVTSRFNPVIFDAIANATLIALKKNISIDFKKLPENRLQLLQDDNFKLYISERTTNVEHINGRINIALNYLFGVKDE